MTYTYNLSGAMIEQKYPSGRVVKNVTDNDGMLSIVQSKKNSNAGYWNYANSLTYNSTGAVESMQLGNGKWESTQFNSRLQPTQIALGTVQNGTDKLKLNYEYNTTGQNDNNGNVLKQTIKVPTVGTNNGFTAVQTYTYDELNRIKDAKEMIGSTETWKQTFTYDRYGNRNFDEANTTTLTKLCGTSPSFTVCSNDRKSENPSISPTNNRIIEDQDSDQDDDYKFDLAGNTTEDVGNTRYTYDGENKQIKVETIDSNGTVTGTVGEYFYDGDGKRVKKVVSSTNEITIFIYDASGKMVAEYSTNVEPTSTAKVSYLTSDHLGSPRITTDKDGDIYTRRDFMPFGEEINVEHTPERTATLNYATDEIRQKFTSYERDNETELDFAQARMHNYNLGRFTSPDDFLNDTHTDAPSSWNLYLYVRNNPLASIDPTGMITDFVDINSGDITRIDDGIDQVLAVDSEFIDAAINVFTDNHETYYNALQAVMDSSANLHLTRAEFQSRAATTYGESSFFRNSVSNAELAKEMKAIAWVNTRNDIAYAAGKEAAKDFIEDSNNNKLTDKMLLANLAIVNQRTGGEDPSNGATGWDGREQGVIPESETRTSVPARQYGGRKGTWEVHKNTLGGKIKDEHYAKWKKAVGKSFKAPQNSKSRKGRYGLRSTAVWGQTIFWRE